MPALKPWLASTGGATLVHVERRVSPKVLVAPYIGGCLRVVQPIAAWSFPTAADLAPADCAGAAPDAAFRYETRLRRQRAPCATSSPGELVTGISGVAIAAMRPGQAVNVVANIGPVRVERQVEAVQTGKPGGHLFVRAANGDVFSVAYGDVQP